MFFSTSFLSELISSSSSQVGFPWFCLFLFLFLLFFHHVTSPPCVKHVMWWNTSLSFVGALEALGLLQQISLLMQIQPNGYHENEIEIMILIEFILRGLVKLLLISSQKDELCTTAAVILESFVSPSALWSISFCSKQCQSWLYLVLLNSGDNLNIRPTLTCCCIYIYIYIYYIYYEEFKPLHSFKGVNTACLIFFLHMQ